MAFTATALAQPQNDTFPGHTHIGGHFFGTNVGATGEQGEPNHAGVSNPLASVWYSFTAHFHSEVFIDTCGSDYDTTLAVYTGHSIHSLTEVASNDDHGGNCGPNGLGSAVRFTAVAGTTYRIAVDGFADEEGRIHGEILSVIP